MKKSTIAENPKSANIPANSQYYCRYVILKLTSQFGTWSTTIFKNMISTLISGDFGQDQSLDLETTFIVVFGNIFGYRIFEDYRLMILELGSQKPPNPTIIIANYRSSPKSPNPRFSPPAFHEINQYRNKSLFTKITKSSKNGWILYFQSKQAGSPVRLLVPVHYLWKRNADTQGSFKVFKI